MSRTGQMDAAGAALAYPRGARRRFFGYAAEDLAVLPLWANSEAPEAIEGVARLQAESWGLVSRQDTSAVAAEPILKQDHRVLLGVRSLVTGRASNRIPASQPPTDLHAAAEFLPLPPNHAVIYRELGRFVLAITQNGRLIFLEPFTATRLDEEAAGEFNRLLLQLQFQGLAEDLDGMVLWTKEAVAPGFAHALGFVPAQAGRPDPALPKAQPVNLVPGVVRAARAARERASRWRKRIGWGVLLSILAALGLAGLSAYELWSKQVLTEELESLSPRAREIEAWREQWLSIAPAVDRETTGLEVLRALQSLPEAGPVVLEKFEWNPQTVTIRGAAGAPRAALQFLDAVNGSEALGRYAWTFDSPDIQGDGSAQFELKGDLVQP